MVTAKTLLAWTVLPSLAYAALTVDSNAGRKIMEHARRLDQNNVDYSFVGDFKLKFQGCHHVHQWNDNVDEENDVKIRTKRLVRFRLCPADQCSDEKTAGCTSRYGDYVVDMNTFVANYFEALQNQKESDCEYGKEVCEDRCDNDEDCMEECYDELSMATASKTKMHRKTDLKSIITWSVPRLHFKTTTVTHITLDLSVLSREVKSIWVYFRTILAPHT